MRRSSPSFLLVLLIISIVLFESCTSKMEPFRMEATQNTGWKIKKIPPSTQQNEGDPEKGFQYMVSGSYLGSGFPLPFIERSLKKDTTKFLKRSKLVSKHGFAVFEAFNGVEVTNGTCFTCHAGAIAGDTILGLGNSFGDFRGNLTLIAKLSNTRMKWQYGKKSPEYIQYKDFGKYFNEMAKYTRTNNPGVNPAARIAESIMRVRDPQSLLPLEEPLYTINEYNIASDIPPLWNVKKKNSLYYTAVGRGDMTKLLFQASVLGIQDSTQARKAQNAFEDVLAWIMALEPPKYPFEIDSISVKKGVVIFNKNCSSCHGTYGEKWTYPNKVISTDVVKTDPLYANYAVTSNITEWYNKSWFATSYPQSKFVPEAGYIAPPLDGIWATAPYLHNGSIPTLESLLNSYIRPKFWKRSGKNEDYNQNAVGWNYTKKKSGKGKWTYDTTLPGYSNQGHTYGDHLTKQQKLSVIEYLKTL